MRWSFSAHASFRRCPRQWFFKRAYANGRANDPLRREAYRLSKLEGIHAWRGKIVDTVLSETVIRAISLKRPYSLAEAKRTADDVSAQQRARRLTANRLSTRTDGAGMFFEVEYGLPLTDEMFETARVEIHTSLENFYNAERVWALLTQAETLVPQRTLSFRHGDVTVQVVPDLIVFRGPSAPVILDWKVNVRPMRDYRLQLVSGAIALTRCTPHRDWPAGAANCHPHEIDLWEVQLLAGDVRDHRFSPAEVEEAEDFISLSANEMLFAVGDEGAGQIGPEDMRVTNDPRTCQTCSFRRLCWRAVT